MHDDWKTLLRQTTQVDQIPGLAPLFDQVLDPIDDPERGHAVWARVLAQVGLAQAVPLVARSAARLALPRALHDIANLLRDLHQTDAAEAAYRHAISLNPNHPYPHHGLGALLLEQKRYEEAEAAFHTAISLDPNHPAPHNGLGIVLYEQKRYEEAEAEYRTAILLDPNYPAPHNGLGNALWSQKRYEEAEAAFRYAIFLDPNNPNPHNGLGVLLSEQKRYEEAEAEYRTAILLDPNNLAPHNGLGNLLLDQKRYEDAEAAFRTAIRLDPNYPDPHNGLGNLLLDQKRYEDAEAAYRTAIRLDPNYPYPHYSLGKVNTQILGKIVCYLECYRLISEQTRLTTERQLLAVCVRNLVRVRAELGQGEEGASWIKEVLERLGRWQDEHPADAAGMLRMRASVLVDSALLLRERGLYVQHSRPGLGGALPALRDALGWLEQADGLEGGAWSCLAESLESVLGWTVALCADGEAGDFARVLVRRVLAAVEELERPAQGRDGLRLARVAAQALVVLVTDRRVSGRLSGGDVQRLHRQVARVLEEPAGQRGAWQLETLRAQLALWLVTLPATPATPPGLAGIEIRPGAVRAWARAGMEGFGREYIGLVEEEVGRDEVRQRNLSYRMRNEAALRTYIAAVLLDLLGVERYREAGEVRLGGEAAVEVIQAVHETRALNDLYQRARLAHTGEEVAAPSGVGLVEGLREGLEERGEGWFEVAASWHHTLTLTIDAGGHAQVRATQTESDLWSGLTERESYWALNHELLHDEVRQLFQGDQRTAQQMTRLNKDLAPHQQRRVEQLRQTLGTRAEVSSPLKGTDPKRKVRFYAKRLVREVLQDQGDEQQAEAVLMAPEGFLHDLPWTSLGLVAGGGALVAGQCLSGPSLLRTLPRGRGAGEGRALIVADTWYLKALGGKIVNGALELERDRGGLRSDLAETSARLRGWAVELLVIDQDAAHGQPFARWFVSPASSRGFTPHEPGERVAPELVVWLTHGGHMALLLGLNSETGRPHKVIDAHMLMRAAQGRALRLPQGADASGGPELDLSRCGHFVSGACSVGRIDIEGADGLDGVGLVRSLMACGVQNIFLPHWPVSIGRISLNTIDGSAHSVEPIGFVLNCLVKHIASNNRPCLARAFRDAVTALQEHLRAPATGDPTHNLPIIDVVHTLGWPGLFTGTLSPERGA